MNPYEVLGIPENASDEQIKTAYKELVRKYHPDKYQNNPLADLAEEKLQEVNEAYDTIMKTRGQGSGGGYGYNNSYNNGYGGGYSYDNSGSYAYGSADYMQIRRNIDAGNLAAAEHMLNETSDRSAEWFFLSGVVSSRKIHALFTVGTYYSMKIPLSQDLTLWYTNSVSFCADYKVRGAQTEND